MTKIDPAARKIKENEETFSKLNKYIQSQIEPLLDEGEEDTEPISFVCECGVPDCNEKIQVPVNTYKNVKRNANQYLIKKDHLIPQVEQVLMEMGEYSLVEKFI